MVLGVGEVGQDSLEMEGLAGVEQRGARGDGAVGRAQGVGTARTEDECAGGMAAGESNGSR